MLPSRELHRIDSVGILWGESIELALNLLEKRTCPGRGGFQLGEGVRVCACKCTQEATLLMGEALRFIYRLFPGVKSFYPWVTFLQVNQTNRSTITPQS